MKRNPNTCTWLDLQAHDHLVDDAFVQADKYEEYSHFLRDGFEDTGGEPKNLRPNA